MSVKYQGGQHVIEFQCRGVRVHRRCPPGTKKTEAVELETKLRKEIFEQKDLGRSPAVSLAAAVEMWLREVVTGRKSERETRNHAHALIDAIEGKALNEIVSVADAYRLTALQPATVNRRLAVLKATAKFAHRKAWLPVNLSSLIPMLPEYNARTVYLSRTEINRLLAALKHDPEARAFTAMAIYTGMRKGELVKLQAKQIRDGVIDLGTNTKTGQPRRIPIIPQAKPFLRFVPFARNVDSLDPVFRRARATVGLDHVHFHDLRHTTASLLIQSGVDLFTVGRILGHSTPATTGRYSHLADATLRAAMDKFSGALRGGKAA